MNVAQDLVLMAARVKIFREATNASADQDFLANIVRSVGTLFMLQANYC